MVKCTKTDAETRLACSSEYIYVKGKRTKLKFIKKKDAVIDKTVKKYEKTPTLNHYTKSSF